MKKKILALGEIIWDVYSDKKVIGGAPLNFSAHAALCGAQSTLISAVGEDSWGSDAIKALQGFQVNVQYVKTVTEPTGQCIVTLGENSVPNYHMLRNAAYDNIKLCQKDFESINAEHYDALYFGTLIQRNYTSRSTLRELVKKCDFKNIICDVNIRPDCYNEESVKFCLCNATILKISIEEEPILRNFGLYLPESEAPKDIARSLCKRFNQLEVIIITLGKDGSYAYVARADKDYQQKAIGDKVVSTVGAGDSFAAAWLINYLNKAPIEQCMKKAAEISGFVVAHTEAVPIYV